MKKLIIFACALALTLSTYGSAFAAEKKSSETDAAIRKTSGSTVTETLNNREEKKAALEQKKSDSKAFREVVKAERDTVKSNREANAALIQENKDLRKNMKEKLKALKDSGVTLDEEVAAALEDLNAELNSVKDELNSTKGDIKEIADGKKESIKSRDYEAMYAAFAEIRAIQDARNEDLGRINEILKEMIDLLP